MNWAYYKITKKWTGGVSDARMKFCKFGLSDSIVFADGPSFNINFLEGGYNALDIGDVVQIDTGRLRFRGMNEVFPPSEALLHFVRSNWQDKCQQMAANWQEREIENKALTGNLNEQIIILRTQSNNWKNKYVEAKNELDSYKKGNAGLHNQLIASKDETIKIVSQNAADMRKQQQDEAKLQADYARSEEKLKNLETKEKELDKKLKDREKVSKLATEILEKLQIDLRDAQQTNLLLLGGQAESEEEKLDALAIKLEIDLKTIYKIKELQGDLMKAVEDEKEDIIKQCGIEIASEKQKLVEKKIKSEHINEIFKVCKETAAMNRKVIKINKNLREHDKLKNEDLLQAQQEVKLLKHN